MRTGRCPVPTDVTTLNPPIARFYCRGFRDVSNKNLICVGPRHRRVLKGTRQCPPHHADGAVPRPCRCNDVEPADWLFLLPGISRCFQQKFDLCRDHATGVSLRGRDSVRLTMRTGRCPVPTDVTTLNPPIGWFYCRGFRDVSNKNLICVGPRHRRVLLGERSNATRERICVSSRGRGVAPSLRM
jgi:hypothetical protein